MRKRRYAWLTLGKVDSGSGMVSAAQIRAARGLVGWSQQELATKTGVARRTITTIEAGGAVSEASVRAIVDTLERAGVFFTGDESNPGVSLHIR